MHNEIKPIVAIKTINPKLPKAPKISSTLSKINKINDNTQEIINLDIISEDSHINLNNNLDNYILEGFDYEYYNNLLQSRLNSAIGTRAKATQTAIFLATEFPKLPYFWGGGHECNINEMYGINPTWGTTKEIIAEGSTFYPVGELFPYSLDCSSYVSWCFINSGFNQEILTSSELKNIGPSYSITSTNIMDNINVGDIGYMEGHVGIIIDINKETNEITFSHISHTGGGMCITTISTETGLIVKDYQGTTDSTLIGKPYFTEIISVPYLD